MVDPALITHVLAEKIHSQLFGDEDQGTEIAGGEPVDWWADRSRVWFYEPGHDGYDTIKRFEMDTQLYEVRR